VHRRGRLPRGSAEMRSPRHAMPLNCRQSGSTMWMTWEASSTRAYLPRGGRRGLGRSGGGGGGGGGGGVELHRRASSRSGDPMVTRNSRIIFVCQSGPPTPPGGQAPAGLERGGYPSSVYRRRHLSAWVTGTKSSLDSGSAVAGVEVERMISLLSTWLRAERGVIRWSCTCHVPYIEWVYSFASEPRA
jgi:hypothetical protein